MEILTTHFILGVLALIFLRYRNSQKNLLDVVSACVLLLFVSRGLMELFWWGKVVWATGSLGLLISYYLRFKCKDPLQLFDWVKWTGVMLLIIYPVIDFGDPVSNVIGHLAIPILASLYVYDRWIFNPEKMKKRFVVILSIQTLLILLFFSYAIIQKAEADVQRQNADIERSRSVQRIKDLTQELQEFKKQGN
jgi:hypothetical protein